MESIARDILDRHREISCPNWLPGKPPCEASCPRCRGWLTIVVSDPKPARPQTRRDPELEVDIVPEWWEGRDAG